MTDGQMTTPCPQCGSAAAVHAISELAALARNPLNQLNQPQPGPAAGPPQGYAGEPQAGPPQAGPPQAGSPQAGSPQASPPQGWMAEPQAGPPAGWAAQPQAGPPPGSRSGPLPGGWSAGSVFSGASEADGLEQVVADLAMGAVTRFIGRKIGRRVQQAYTDRVLPALAARQAALGDQAAPGDQAAIAERYPGLRACLTDKVIFLAGGSRVIPMTSVNGTLTLAQADALVEQLREG
jgi:hypothetical protein